MRGKSAEDWGRVMSDEGGGLAKFTDTVLTEAEKMTEADWREMYENNKQGWQDFEILASGGAELLRSKAEEFFPSLQCFKEQYPKYNFAIPNESLFLNVNAAPHMARFLLAVNAILSDTFTSVMPDHRTTHFEALLWTFRPRKP